MLSTAEKWIFFFFLISGGVSDVTNSEIMGTESRLMWAEQWEGVQEKDTVSTLLEKSIQHEKVRKGW